jgi:hypothetical protein
MSAVNTGAQLVKNGLILGLDSSYIRSYSPNVIPTPTDIFAWAGINSANAAVLSRDTSMTRQYGSIPMKMAITGNDPFTNTVNYGPGALSTWNLAPAANGQTWTISVYVKASVATTGELFFLPADSNGVAITSASGTVSITTAWTRVSFTYTISSATTAFIQARLDGTPTGGSGINIWWDGLQVERSSTATQFNPYYIGNDIWRDVSGLNNSFTLVNAPTFSGGVFTLNGSTQYASITTTSGFFTSATNNFYADVGYAWSISAWFKFPVSPATTRNSGNNGGNCSYCIVGNGGGIGGAETLALFVSGGDATTSAGALSPYYCVVGIRGGKTQLSVGSVNTNTWNNVIVTWNGSAGRGYFNGVDKGALNNGGQGMQAGYAPTIGTTAGGNQGSHTFEGNVAQVFIYNRALTATEASQNYEADKSRFGL